ncbi:protein bric-a-brac 2-like isoform X5 [Periplaneta americana]|uniref:protein bric-a-brac 2-like isoform X5 n=1 Tax=Periplaneta americana TaxID=6978 RepID=UPI0037E77B73
METSELLCRLKSRPFTSWSLQERRAVPRLRPMPPLDITVVDGRQNRKFQYSWYSKYPWLAGCETTRRLYCFPCMLLGGDREWAHLGVAEIKNFLRKAEKHQHSSLHLQHMEEFVRLESPIVDESPVDVKAEIPDAGPSSTDSFMEVFPHRRSADWTVPPTLDADVKPLIVGSASVPADSSSDQASWSFQEVPQQAPPGTKQVVAPTPPVKKSLPQVSQPSPKPAITKPAPPRPVSPPQPPPPPPEVCLRWNSYHSNMQATFPSLLNNEQFVDVTLACEGRSIKCHKMMLSACSSYFEELLSQNPCQHPIVLMKDLKFWEVQALVDFMYRGEVNVGQDKLPSLLAAAEALQIKGLAGPASTSSSHDEDSLPPSLPLTADDYLDESTSSPSSARRARKRRTIAALPTPRQNTISPHRNPVGRPRLVRPSPQPSTSTSSYHQASVASEPPLRRARRSEPASLPVGQEIKVEPVDIDISNDSMDPIDDGFDMNKTYDGSSGGGGGGGGGGGSGGGGAGAGAGDVSDTSKQDDEAGGGTEGEITGNLTDDNRAIISGHDSDHMDYGNNNGMNSEATTTQAGRENSIEIQGYSYTEGSSDDPTMSSSDMNMTYPEVVLNPGAENASSDSILGHL